MRVGALASGTGSILEAILDAGIPVDLVVTDRRCAALDLAEARGVAADHSTDGRSHGPSE